LFILFSENWKGILHLLKEKLDEEKGKKTQGIWDLDPGATEKAEHDFSGQP